MVLARISWNTQSMADKSLKVIKLNPLILANKCALNIVPYIDLQETQATIKYIIEIYHQRWNSSY